MHVEVRRQRHAQRLAGFHLPIGAGPYFPASGEETVYKIGSVGYVVEGTAYVGGTVLIGAGLYLVLRGTFPTWWRERLLWPLVRLTPTVSHLQGWAAVGLGVSILALVFTTVAPDVVAGLLVVLAMAAYVVAVGLFLFSTWLSRRSAA